MVICYKSQQHGAREKEDIRYEKRAHSKIRRQCKGLHAYEDHWSRGHTKRFKGLEAQWPKLRLLT